MCNAPNTLTEIQIDYALQEIEHIHPIVESQMYVVFPWLLGWTKYFYKKEDTGIREPLLTPRSEKLKEKNKTINMLGHGIQTYLNMMAQLIWLFALISVLAIPILLGYGNNEGAYISHQTDLETLTRTLEPIGDE